MRIFYVLSLLLLISFSGAAQDRCGSAEYLKKAMLSDPSLRENIRRVEGFTAARLREQPVFEYSANQPEAARPIIIPVVVHVVYRTNQENISDDQIRSQIDALNADFSRTNPDFSRVPSVFAALAADAGIRFALAKSDPDGRATTGIIRKKSDRQFWTDDDKVKMESEGGSAAWDTHHYLNFWICNTPDGLLGYGTFPGGAVEKDGVVIRYNVFGTRGVLQVPFDKGRTATHEVGHWLNLIHIWGDTDCGDDGVQDTPRQKTHNKGNPVFPHVNASCDSGVNGDMFMNFMDFSDDASLNMFTMGQRDRMQAQFAVGGARNGFLTTTGLAEPWNTTAAAPASLSAESALRIYPNPAVGSTATISVNAEMAGQRYGIFAADGHLVMSGSLSSNKQDLDLGHMQAGVYFVKVGNGRLAGKFIKN